MMRLLTKLSFQTHFFQLMRFGITGTLVTLVHFSIVILLVETEHLHPLTANTYGFLCGFIISFSGHRFWTFSETSRTLRSSLPRFFFIAALNFIGNQTFYYLLLDKLHMHYTIALLLVLSFMATITFFLSKLWAFPR